MATDTDPQSTFKDPIWKRFLISIVFLILFGLAETLILFITIAQLLWTAFTRSPNIALVDFGAMLGKWTQQVVAFQSMKSDERPFPWGEWPKE